MSYLKPETLNEPGTVLQILPSFAQVKEVPALVIPNFVWIYFDNSNNFQKTLSGISVHRYSNENNVPNLSERNTDNSFQVKSQVHTRFSKEKK